MDILYKPKQLAELISKSDELFNLLQGDGDYPVSDICYDSRKASEKSLFVAVEGFTSDGHDFIPSAYESGCRAFLISASKSSLCSKFPDANFLSTTESRSALSRVSAIFYDEVSRRIPVIGVTGTNGKTTVTYMIEAVCRKAGMRPGVLGTVNYRWNDTVESAPNTTPESRDIHSIMYRMAEDGVDVIIMEVSSHGLSLGRVNDIHFSAALFTNLTQDHLDFHTDFEDYYKAKKKLFTLLENSNAPLNKRYAIINGDDPYGERLFKELKDKPFELRKMGSENCYYALDNDSVDARLSGISYRVVTPDGSYNLNLHLTARFNIYNSLIAFGALDALGIEREIIVQGLSEIESVPGRFDRIASPFGFYVVVDYAHTDDALIKLLQSAREINPKRIITVFGCGGDRDRKKRPLMGHAGVKLSDHAFVTSDNPRTEDPGEIIKHILSGIEDGDGEYEVIVDRREAIAAAVNYAQADDLLVIAGKGHEDYQIVGKVKSHFDDKEVAAYFIQERKLREG
ncbi:MAG: UDP-N-acetylmuramoyl-L-alanyl-D-glutamate--2,6-diaminopimelate ligase [Spirochaetes bacterium]|jgi:UDP-N-acetylmuramoyl-L-alanyl-D-glutamate--2,6-diaminopimelate ligase|nr:UDP-N-acetylmuramoyl-L-alanyl-D-glutamate--2,6-diaminopimelate ligase [Spirochaetota bacterium]